MAEFTRMVAEVSPVKYLVLRAPVRDWSACAINNVICSDGTCDLAGIPCRNGDYWEPTIDVDTGAIQGWPTTPTILSAWWEVEDYGTYASLMGPNHERVVATLGNPPQLTRYYHRYPDQNGHNMMSFSVQSDGTIRDWKLDLLRFGDQHAIDQRNMQDARCRGRLTL